MLHNFGVFLLLFLAFFNEIFVHRISNFKFQLTLNKGDYNRPKLKKKSVSFQMCYYKPQCNTVSITDGCIVEHCPWWKHRMFNSCTTLRLSVMEKPEVSVSQCNIVLVASLDYISVIVRAGRCRNVLHPTLKQVFIVGNSDFLNTYINCF